MQDMRDLNSVFATPELLRRIAEVEKYSRGPVE